MGPTVISQCLARPEEEQPQVVSSASLFPFQLHTCVNKGSAEDGDSSVRPITVLYHEIDSHVGGRAAIAVAKLLRDQGRGANQIMRDVARMAAGELVDVEGL